MPLVQAVSAVLETALNQVLALDGQSAIRLRKLNDKTLLVYVKEFDHYFLFSFAKTIHLLAGNAESESDCFISLSLESIPSLAKNQHLTQLIKDNKLDIDGDLHVAQEFSHILLNLNIDWEEKLSLYTGDIVANHIFKSLTKAKNTLSTQRNKVIEMIKNGAIEEKKIAAPIIAVTHFCDQVSDLRSDFARLDKRLARLEAKQ